MEVTYLSKNNKCLKISLFHINESYEQDIYDINFLTIPTPSRLMGKDINIIKNWRIYMNDKQKNGLLKNNDLYKFILHN